MGIFARIVAWLVNNLLPIVYFLANYTQEKKSLVVFMKKDLFKLLFSLLCLCITKSRRELQNKTVVVCEFGLVWVFLGVCICLGFVYLFLIYAWSLQDQQVEGVVFSVL